MSFAPCTSGTTLPVWAHSARRTDVAASTNAFAELVVTDLRPELAKINVPTTVLYVTPASVPISDAQIDAAYQANYAALSGVRLKRMPDAAHFIMLDQPGRFMAEVKRFLD